MTVMPITIPHGEKPKGPCAAGARAMAAWTLEMKVTNTPSTKRKPAIAELWT